jgi:hypothetical protein
MITVRSLESPEASMRKTLTLALAALLAAAAIAGLSCAEGVADSAGTAQGAAASVAPVLDETYVESAVVTRVGLEGGFWGLVGATDMDRLDPMKPIPAEFQKDGLRVKIWYIPRKDLASARMWGLVIDLRRIERIE